VIKIILLDGMMQLYRCNYKLSELTTRDDRPTGMEFGFLKGLEAFRRFWKDEIIICWEGKNNFRYKIDPEYKANRRDKRKRDAHKFLNIERIEKFKEFLSMVAESAYDDTLEADDIIASLAAKYSQVEKTIIYSSDKDFLQLLRNKPFPIIQIPQFQQRNNPRTVSWIEENFYGLKPEQLKIYFAIIGDKVDNIKGVNKVRKSKIAAALCANKELKNIFNYELFSAREIDELEKFFDSGQFKINLQLITLKIKNDIIVKQRNWQPKEIRKWLYNMEFRTLKLCEKCGLEGRIEQGDEF